MIFKELNNKITELGMSLSEVKEAFIIEELEPYFTNKKLHQTLKLRLQEKKDWEQTVKEAIEKVHNKSTIEDEGKYFKRDLFKELGL